MNLNQYQVDDWVEVEGGEHCLISMVGRDLGSGHCYYFKNSTGVMYESDIVRKLKASEVIISIGCLSGRVEKMDTASIRPWAFLLVHANGDCSCIMFSALDDETREIVESLLKRIEDE